MSRRHFLAGWGRAGCLSLVTGLVLLLFPQPGQPAQRDGDADDQGGKPTVAQRRQSADNLRRLAWAMVDLAIENRARLPVEYRHRLLSAAHLDFDVRTRLGNPQLTTEQLARANGQYQGKRLPLLSWRVALLPHIKEAKLYREFKLDEPWDSEHNNKLIAKMPKVYAPVRGKTREPGMTYYQVFVGKDAPFNGTIMPKFPVRFQDGTSWTFLIVEAGEPVPWTKPQDIVYDAGKPLPRLGGLFPDGFHVGMADGSAHFVPRDVDERTIRAMITPSGGETIEGRPLKQVK
jgi:hypothetical protein